MIDSRPRGRLSEQSLPSCPPLTPHHPPRLKTVSIFIHSLIYPPPPASLWKTTAGLLLWLSPLSAQYLLPPFISGDVTTFFVSAPQMARLIFSAQSVAGRK